MRAWHCNTPDGKTVDIAFFKKIILHFNLLAILVLIFINVFKKKQQQNDVETVDSTKFQRKSCKIQNYQSVNTMIPLLHQRKLSYN